MSDTSPPKYIFISYTHDNPEHKAQVLALSNRLRDEGVVSELDRHHETNPPAQGWPRWMEDIIESSDFVLVVCTDIYHRRFRGHESTGRGQGAQWEGLLITQEIYNHVAKTNKFIPIGFGSYGANSAHVPAPLQGKNYYDVSTEEGYESLYRQITGQPTVVPAPVGTVRRLAPHSGVEPTNP